MRFIFLFLFLCACGTKMQTVTAPAPDPKSLAGAWTGISDIIIIEPASSIDGTLLREYMTGGWCRYTYTLDFSDPSDHDQYAGVMTIANSSTDVIAPGMLPCLAMEGAWTYAVLVSNSLQLCQSGLCMELK